MTSPHPSDAVSKIYNDRNLEGCERREALKALVAERPDDATLAGLVATALRDHEIREVGARAAAIRILHDPDLTAASRKEAMQALSDRNDNDINVDSLPGDRVTEAMLMALDELWAEGADPETRQAAWSLLQHVRDVDGMVHDDALALPGFAATVAAAFEVWTCRDPWGRIWTSCAQSAMTPVLGYRPKSPKYVPYWKGEDGEPDEREFPHFS